MKQLVRLMIPEGHITSARAYPEGWVVRELDEGGVALGSHLVPANGLLFVNGQYRELPPLPARSRRSNDDDDDEGEIL